MLIAKIENNVVTDVADYRAMFPSVVFPDGGPTDAWLAANSCMRVNVFKPHDAMTQTIEPVTPYIEGEWVYTVAVRDMTQSELDARTDSQAAQVRADRNKKLANTDWTQVIDAPVDQAAWAAYRQALRDISSQEGFPWTIDWPTMP